MSYFVHTPGQVFNRKKIHQYERANRDEIARTEYRARDLTGILPDNQDLFTEIAGAALVDLLDGRRGYFSLFGLEVKAADDT